ncbi:MAG: 50S ribosomal protein L4 [Sphingobacteriales bacterium 17-39-43]|jgi:large subunit ribosomal protein L4|uniref:50S ribosomal protein L4 n=1 Tax=Daejeonella sp. TaxID=2805397 RepID=UPI000BD1145D|nr:50S ribosomal protein L4 [Daejeonella sp.]OYZ28855.1 MAG: 50S ribosomal protein L4 [Sphingobacteriales bacterium 16-39-50]OYZ59229.1 MAG: 50S ribosomal protein L4 [Sphingobacteriales bacterium 24-40-4]OZA22191.1 MAG: 50S ribosomal protein L4 [Sphingobacteriales bacterium 17-39-43]HQS04129.1 50S ribosomal protein L4 [Daejeonella sp.]HQT24293.1 50S ribosomal protein L4 [Daejeonella sp.]
MEVKVINISGKETGAKVQLPDAIFAVEPNDHAIYLDVKQYLANQRQGTHKSKQRNEIAGSTKKLYKQKGTGGARAGSIKSPLFNGGGRVFGPQPRDYSFKLNKKLKSLARKSALTYKAKDNNIVVLEAFTFDSIKTANYAKIVADLKLTDVKSLLVLPAANNNVYLSSRNLKKAKVVTAAELNTFDVLNAGTLLLTTETVKTLEEAFAK